MTDKPKGWFFLVGAIVAEVTGSLSLKGALETPALYVIVVVGYTAAFALLSLVLRTGMSLGAAYGIWGACGVALTALLSLVIFGEPLTVPMGIGILVVIAGVLCVEFGAQAARSTSTEDA
ncbi:SMR family transporter [Microbacterium sp.]|uniref:DMT family transporter n=1 Tax=Microbacterium sp. TaxID=51671 RepID=UPI0026154E62|nr:SMR family transporter [Microbacterium sp.]